MLKLKFGLLTVSLIFLLTGSRLLFGSWTSIHLLFWILIALIIYFGLYSTYRSTRRKDSQIIFNRFDVIGTVTIVGIIFLATIMAFIFLPHISFLFFGLTLATLVVVGGLKFITFDLDKKIVYGLVENGDPILTSMTVDIHSGNTQIEIRTPDTDNILVIKKEMYNNNVWIQLVDNFQKIKVRT